MNEECEEGTLPKPVLNIAFKKFTDATRTQLKSADTLLNITKAYAVGLENSPFLTLSSKNPDSLSKTVTLQLSPSAESTTFYLEGKTANKVPFNRSFTVTYNRQPKFISQACGFEVRYSNITVEEPYTDFDDILVITPEIDPIRNEVHIQLYFKP